MIHESPYESHTKRTTNCAGVCGSGRCDQLFDGANWQQKWLLVETLEKWLHLETFQPDASTYRNKWLPVAIKITNGPFRLTIYATFKIIKFYQPFVKRKKIMGKIKLWWNDLKRGKNLEVFISLIIAIIVMILGLFDFVEQKLLTAVILMVLALLAVNNLNIRYDLSQLDETLVRFNNNLLKFEVEGSAVGFLKERNEVGKISELIAGVHCIELSALAGNFVVVDFDMWEKKLKSGIKVKLLLANPCDDEFICTLTSRCDPMTEGFTEDLQRDINRTVRKLVIVQRKIKENGYPGTLEFKFHSIVPTFGIFGIDPDSPNGVIKVEMYPYRTPISERPHFFLKKNRDGKWYNLFREEFEKQWEIAVGFDSIKDCKSFNWIDISLEPKEN